jgi:hypothetical protein
VVPDQPRPKSLHDLKKLGMVAFASTDNAKVKIGSQCRLSWAKSEIVSIN